MPQNLSKVTSSKPLPQKSTVRVSKIIILVRNFHIHKLVKFIEQNYSSQIDCKFLTGM